ncbi:DUF3592 domain-containing protein [Kitasatospora brasiliensis]|uniref:DUF3592 domain-containing protein n=1 Tax=Kitasatospora brasiliensis TaxID=3058040 RepID=UPI00292DF18D|nr:DUF3592 domain-containing protein [Kitasatospora sp. K002]
MDTTTAMVGGLVFTLFGGALLLWCAAEVRLRLWVRRRGMSAVATVVAEEDVHGRLDSAPLLSFSVPPSACGTGACGIAGLVVARPRGHTPLRRSDRLAPGASVRICYDPRRPSRVVPAAGEVRRAAVVDLLWSLLGVGCLTAGAGLLAAAGV